MEHIMKAQAEVLYVVDPVDDQARALPGDVRSRDCRKAGRLQRLYEQFCKCLKLGVHEEVANRTKVSKRMRYLTSVW
jgi:hypothetical protein